MGGVTGRWDSDQDVKWKKKKEEGGMSDLLPKNMSSLELLI